MQGCIAYANVGAADAHNRLVMTVFPILCKLLMHSYGGGATNDSVQCCIASPNCFTSGDRVATVQLLLPMHLLDCRFELSGREATKQFE